MKKLKNRVLAAVLALVLYLTPMPAMAAAEAVVKLLKPAIVCVVVQTPAHVVICFDASGAPSWIA